MIFSRLISALLILLTAMPAWSLDPAVGPLEKIPLATFTPPEIETSTLKNGMRIFVLPDFELPIFEMSILLKIGTVYEDPSKLGITNLLFSGLTTGGTQSKSGSEIDRELEQVASQITSEVGSEYSIIKVRCLRQNWEKTLSILFDILAHPRFEPGKIDRARDRLLDGIRRRNEDPTGLAVREFRQGLYGRESVWARVPTEKTVSGITAEDIRLYYEKYFSTDQIWAAVSGDVTQGEAVRLIKKLSKPLPKRNVVFPVLPEVQKQWQPGVHLIAKDVNQSNLVLGHFGDKRFNPDKYALAVANYLIGGSTFGSRLGNRIRTRLGLAYSVYSAFGMDTDYGLFLMLISTKSDSTVQVIEEVGKVLSQMQGDSPVTQAELEEAKKTILNQLLFQYEQPSEIVEKEVFYRFYNYPPDYLTVYQREIGKVTVDDVNRVLKQYFFPDRLSVVVVGSPLQREALKSFGGFDEWPLDNE